MKEKSVLCIRGYVRPPLTEQLARNLDRQITTCQEWLERPDKPAARLVAKVVLITIAMYIATHIVLRVCR